MIMIGRQSRTGVGFIPAAYDPEPADVKFVGAMGILGIAGYGFTFVGTIAFMLFSLLAFQRGKPESRNSKYFKSRFRFYSVAIYCAGMSQLALAVYIYMRFETLGKLDNGPIIVAFYVVNMPVLTGIVGILQTLVGAWGFARTSCTCSEDNGKLFQILVFITSVLQLTMQAITNPSLTPASVTDEETGETTDLPSTAGNAPTVAAFALALSLMPSYLNYKTTFTPEKIEPAYYGNEDDTDPESEPGTPSTKASTKKTGKSSKYSDEQVEAMEKKQKALERSIVQLAKKQREMERSMSTKRPGQDSALSMSDPSLTLG